MKVNILGFKISLAKNISISSFFNELVKNQDQEFTIHGRCHIPYITETENYIVGLIVSFRSNKKSMISQRNDDGDLIVTKHALNDNQHGTEVSIFCFNPVTLRGLIYSYTGAVSATSFRDLVKKQHNTLRKRMIAEYKELLDEAGQVKKKDLHKTASAKYQGEFDITLLATPSDINHIIDRFKEIKRLSLRSEDALGQAGIFTQLDTYSKKASIQVDIEENQPLKQVKKAITSVYKALLNSKTEQALRVFGTANSGEELDLIVGENKDNFGKLKYDDYVDELPRLKWIDYTSSPALKRLLNVLKNNNSVFGQPPNDSWK